MRMKKDITPNSSGWLAKFSRLLIFTIVIILFIFLGLGWYQPNVAVAETLTVSNPYSIPTGTKYDTAAYVLMQRLQLDSGGSLVDGKVVVSSVTITAGNAASFNAARVYISSTSSTTLPSNAVDVGRTTLGSTWNGASTAITLSSSATVTTGNTMYLYILLDMAPGTSGSTAITRVTAMNVGTDTLSATLPIISNTITLVAGGAKATVVNCYDCHGDASASQWAMDGPRSAATGSFLGSHNKHAVSQSYPCSFCHSGGALSYTNTGHRDGYINIATSGIYTFGMGGAGSYTKATGPTYSFPQVNNPSLPLGTCNTVYCHSTAQNTSGVSPATYKTPSWGAAGPLSCGACHVDMSGTSATGRHVVHANSYSMACSTCHAGYTSTTVSLATHANNTIDVKLPTGFYTGGTVSGNHAPQGGYGKCLNFYCHSQGTTLNSPFSMPKTTPDWGITFDCTGCHGFDSASTTRMVSGSHDRHVVSSSISCNYCHNSTTTTGTTITTIANHVNQWIDIAWNAYNPSGLVGGLSSTAHTPGTTPVQCSSLNCHGGGTPTWSTGNTTYAECTKCHGNQSSTASYVLYKAAPGADGVGRDTSGNVGIVSSNISTFPRVGAHDAHVRALNSYTTIPIACSECHLVPATSMTASHFDSALPAAVTFGGRAVADGATPSFSTVTRQCTNVYCHGTTKADTSIATRVTPSWSTNLLAGTGGADCGKCHGNPPNTGGHSAVTPNQCQACHEHANNGAIVAPFFSDRNGYLASMHINGTLEGGAGGGPCFNCHTVYQNAMSSTGTATRSSYHHVLTANSDSHFGTGTYPTSTSAKYCVSCHTDHDYFSSNKGANLRQDILSTNGALTLNSDYSSSLANYGICVSCHKNDLAINNTGQLATGLTTTALAISGASFSTSGHNFSVPTSYGTSTFYANCSKCHNDEQVETKQTSANKVGTHFSYAQNLTSGMNLTNPTQGLDWEEGVCFRCHSRTSDTFTYTTSKTTQSYDWYGVQAMSAAAENIYRVISGATTSYAFKHNVLATRGTHSDTEGSAANNGTLKGTNRHIECADCHDPHVAKPVASGNLAGVVSSYATGVTPSTLFANPNPVWTPNQFAGWTVRITEGIGAGQESVITRNTTTGLQGVQFSTAPTSTSDFVIFKVGTRDGNTVNGAQQGVWGVIPSWPAQPTPPNWNDSAGIPANASEITTQFTAISTWTRTENASLQGYICIKCHSAYAYGSTPPNTPSGLPNSTTSTAWNNAVGGTMPQADKASEFNPNNIGYHPLFAIGRNQPIRANYGKTGITSGINLNWPRYSTANAADTVIVSNGTATFGGTAQLPSNVIPGWFLYIGLDTPANNLETAGTSTRGYLEIVSITSSTIFSVRVDSGTTNTNPWPPTYSSAVSVASTSNWFVTAGLGNNFIPPWGPWSTMRCSDCHEADGTTDPMGPHGSATKYMLKKSAGKWVFDFFNGTQVTKMTISAAASTHTPYWSCHNCHRLDIYGQSGTFGTVLNYARASHNEDQATRVMRYSLWGISCMNCHGGARAGAMHGLNLGRGGGGTAGSYSGKRLLAGSNWYGVTRPGPTTGSCYVKGTADAVDNCADGSAGSIGTANYRYDDTTP